MPKWLHCLSSKCHTLPRSAYDLKIEEHTQTHNSSDRLVGRRADSGCWIDSYILRATDWVTLTAGKHGGTQVTVGFFRSTSSLLPLKLQRHPSATAPAPQLGCLSRSQGETDSLQEQCVCENASEICTLCINKCFCVWAQALTQRLKHAQGNVLVCHSTRKGRSDRMIGMRLFIVNKNKGWQAGWLLHRNAPCSHRHRLRNTNTAVDCHSAVNGVWVWVLFTWYSPVKGWQKQCVAVGAPLYLKTKGREMLWHTRQQG